MMHEPAVGLDPETLGSGVHNPMTFRRFSPEKATKDHSERRKFRMSCC